MSGQVVAAVVVTLLVVAAGGTSVVALSPAGLSKKSMLDPGGKSGNSEAVALLAGYPFGSWGATGVVLPLLRSISRVDGVVGVIFVGFW